MMVSPVRHAILCTQNVAGVKRFFEWINDNISVTSFVVGTVAWDVEGRLTGRAGPDRP